MSLILGNISKTIQKKTIIQNIDYCFESGKIYGLKGKNGCGKTMLLRIIAGLVRPTSGKVIINDKELHKDIEFPPSIGVLIENPAFYDNLTGYKNLEMIYEYSKKDDSGKKEIIRLMEEFNLKPEDKIKYKKYSLGMKQKIGIICAIMEHPDIIILDEPINALDEDSVEIFFKLIHEEKERGAIIIVTMHDSESLLANSDSIILIENNTITRGKNE